MLEEFTKLEPDTNPNRPSPMDWQRYSDTVLQEWYALLLTDPDEPAVQEFLEYHPAMIPGGSGDVGPGGHHGSDLHAVFARPTLSGAGRSFEPDFMWVTRSSSVITPILIEIEKPSKQWFTIEGRPTATFSQAHDQLNDWRTWFSRSGNDKIFREQYLLLDDDPHKPLVPQYVLIYGRAAEFQFGGRHKNPDELTSKRNGMRLPDEKFYTFDSLKPRFEHNSSITFKMRATGPEPYAFSPMFMPGPWISDGALILGDFSQALTRTKLMSDERRTYINTRLNHWQDIERQKNAGQIRVGIRSLGRE